MKQRFLKSLLVSAAVLAASGAAAQSNPWVDWDQIQHWAGDPDGKNRCALVIDFQDERDGGTAFVWGYRWNGTATGEDLVRAVASQSSVLTAMIQYTGTMGSTLNSLGVSPKRQELDYLHYDFDRAAIGGEVSFDYFTPNTSMGQDSAPGYEAEQMCKDAIERAKTSGIIEHPLNAFVYGYPAYDYDYWQLEEGYAEDDMFRWRSGWYDGYWSYWHGSNDYDMMSYSGLGMSSTVLTNECVQAWKWISFNSGGIGYMGEDLAENLDYENSFFEEEMHEAPVVVQPVDQNDVKFWVGEGEKSAVVAFQFNDAKGPENLIYGYRWTGGWDDNLKTVIETIAKADPRMSFTAEGGEFKLTYDSDNDGKLGQYDHTDTSDTWNCYVKRTVDAGFNKVNSGRWLNPNAVFIFSHQPADVAEVSLPYQLFRPALDSDQLITIPTRMDYALADDELLIPMFIQFPEGGKMSTGFNWTRDEAITAVTTGMSVTNLMGKIRAYKDFKPTVGVVKVRGSHTPAGQTKAEYVFSNDMTLSLQNPVCPITSLHYAEATVDARLSHPVDNVLVFEPADATYTKINYTTSNRNVASLNATTGAVSTSTMAGEAVITATYGLDPNVTASYSLTSSLKVPVQDITFDCVGEDGTITLTPKEMFGLIPVFTPEDPDISNVTVELSDNGTGKDNYIATMYTVNYWPDGGSTMSRFNELSGHREGECKLTVKANDGSGIEKEFIVRVVDREREPQIDYNEGTIMLNEEWYGHTNGGLNWYSPDYDITYQAYERENPGMSFGCTSQYGIIYDGKLLITSKQASDGGDPLPGGGRLVIADATTLKRLGSIDDLMVEDESRSGDGRAICGAGAGRAYMGTHSGIYIIDIDNATILGKVKGTVEGTASDLYNGQVGDMLLAGRYAYALQQNAGLYVIDTETDLVVKKIEDKNVQGLAQSMDGTVWYATIDGANSKFVPVDMNSLEVGEAVIVPASIGKVTCGWGAWRSTQFTGAKTVNKLFFAPGSGITNGGDGVYYSYDIDSGEFFKIADITGMESHTPNVKQGAYGTIRYDDRTGELIVGTTEYKASGHYRYNWTHFFNAETGELVRTIELRPYYWFQSMPVFPDKYDAEINLEDIALTVNDGVRELDLSELVTDADNIDANIRFSILDNASVLDDVDSSVTPVTFAIEGRRLILTPVANGTRTLTLAAESNGRVVTKTVNVTVADTTTGIDGIGTDRQVTCDGSSIFFKGFAGHKFDVYDMGGRRLFDLNVEDDLLKARLGLAPGIYLLRSGRYVATVVLK